jgi:outer membrane protein assembly factor BamA
MKTLFACALIALIALTPLACLAQVEESDSPLVVDDVQCRGNALTACEFITGHVYLGAGDRLDEEELQNAKLRLTSLSNFESVDVRLEKGSAKGRVIVIVEVTEANPLETEWLVGVSSRLEAVRQVLAGRATHHNLFGAGKFGSATAAGAIPIDGPETREFSAGLVYADPHLFDSKRYFAVASVGYTNGRGEDLYGSFGEAELLRFGANVGRRLWDFSYVWVGYGYRAKLDVRSGRWQKDGTFELDEDENRHAVDVIYGWNSEDNLFFPTRGSSFHVGFGWNFGSDDEGNEFHFQYRKTWATDAGSLWTLKIGGEPSSEFRTTFGENQLLSFSYARPFAHPDVRRGRWYIEPGYSQGGFAPGGREIHEVGLKVGVRLETRAFGLVDLYLMATFNPDGRESTT